MRSLLRLMISFGIMFLIAACQTPTPEPTPTPTDTPVPPTAVPTETPIPLPTSTPAIIPDTYARNPADQVYLRVIHAAVDTETVDLYIELLAVATNLQFGQNTESTGIVAGDYNVQVVPSGTRPDEAPLLRMPLSLQGGKSYILLFTGTPDARSLSIFEESIEPLGSGEGRVSVIHAVPRGVDFVLRAGNSDLSPTLTFGQQSTPIILPSGTTNFIFQSGSNVLITQPINLRERYAHTLVLVGRPDDLSSLKVINLPTLAPGRSSIRVINGSTAATNIDVYLDHVRLIQDAGYGRQSAYQSVATSVYNAKVYAAGVDPAAVDPLTSTQVNANPDDRISLILVGSSLNTLRFVSFKQNFSPTLPTDARIAFMNTLDTVPRIRVEFAGGRVPDVPDLGYSQVSPEVLLEAGTYDFYWQQIENNAVTNPIEIGTRIQLDAGRSYLYLATGRVDDPPLILSDNVGIDNNLANISPDVQVTATPTIPVQVRFVNAITTGTLINFLVDDTIVANAIPYSAQSPLITIEEGEHVITVRNAGSDTLIARLLYSFDLPGNYSIFAYGSETDTGIDLLPVPDLNLVMNDEAPHMRLINLSQEVPTQFGLAYAPAGYAPIVESTTVSPENAPDETFRRSIIAGVIRFIDNVENAGFSDVATLLPGEFSILVTDSAREQVAANIPNVDLAAGVHYDVVAFQEFGLLRVKMFILTYPNEQ